jgi:hypothetical protein
MKENELTEPVDVCSCELEVIIDNHEPPIGFGGGSFFCDIPAANFILTRDAIHDTATHKRYIFSGISPTHRPFKAIDNICVMTEVAVNGNVRFEKFTIDPHSGLMPKLNLWLTDGLRPPSGDPDVIVIVEMLDGNLDGSMLVSQEFNFPAETLTKRRRTERYRHPDPNIRVAKWEVVDAAHGDAQILLPSGASMGASEDDLYYIYVAFDD